jgi:hypothetical protein
MKKLNLNLTDLCVESFEPADPSAAAGTVRGQTYAGTDDCLPSYDYGDDTCLGTCDFDTCAYTCADTCGSTCDQTCSNCATETPICGIEPI